MVAQPTTYDPQAKPVQRALARSALYRLLSLACAYPSPTTLAFLREEALPTARLGAQVVAGKAAPTLMVMAEELWRAGPDGLGRAYQRALSHVAAADCPPYESAYTAHHLFQQTQVMADVAGFYRAFGFEASTANRERVDHVGVELEFMHLLCHKEAYALVHHGRGRARLCRRAQRRFWGDHLGRWLERFAALLATRAGEGFYGYLARAAAVFASSETRLLGEAPAPAAASEGDEATAGWTSGGADDGCPVG